VKTVIWPETVREAREAQDSLKKRLKIRPLAREPRLIAALDAAFSGVGAGGMVFGAACLFAYPSIDLIEEAACELPCDFPYVPGYLTFREGPALLAALNRLRKRPDIIIVDGQGIAHPRGMGIASHLGVLLGLPGIGCAKSRLVGEYDEPGRARGKSSPLVYEGNTVGAVLRTREGVRPVFVSPGHLIDLEGAVRIVLNSTGKYRISEPLRCAHRAAGRAKEEFEGRGILREK